jgi:NAD(P)-dependent dehydrogenase (short-subunit alcohol dehydrogenase family)
VSRVIETEWSERGVKSTTLYYPLVKTPMISPTKAFDDLPAMTPQEAAEWMITAARRQPVRIAPRMSLLSQALDIVSPDFFTSLMKRQSVTSDPTNPA